jgi:hypothetical protein
MKECVCDACLYVCESAPINFRTPEPISTKFGMYIMAPELISMEYIINSSRQSVCVGMCIPPIVARQRYSKVCPSFH